MTPLATITAFFPAAASPAKLAGAQWLMILFSIGIIALFFAWLLARRMRMRFVQMTAGSDSRIEQRDAWTEAARRIGEDDDPIDPDQSPPQQPDPRWQT